MAHLTIAVDEDTLDEAEQRARHEGTSVEQLLRDYLDAYANSDHPQAAAARNFMTIAEESKSGHIGRGRAREELYDRHVLRKR
jgi:hypothetical protein